jgi:hypothetical protein
MADNIATISSILSLGLEFPFCVYGCATGLLLSTVLPQALQNVSLSRSGAPQPVQKLGE